VAEVAVFKFCGIVAVDTGTYPLLLSPISPRRLQTFLWSSMSKSNGCGRKRIVWYVL
jgi:hypothetical protein